MFSEPTSYNLLLALDLLGTFIFALSGATAGVRNRLDVFGVMVLSFAAATVGGITRDIVIGSTPPASIRDWRYLTVSMLAGIAALLWYTQVDRLQSPVLIFDAAGLGLFAVSGATKAISYDLSVTAVLMIGVLSGVGGGVARDLLINKIPSVLQSELYAVAALAAAIVVVTGDALDVPMVPVSITGAVLCFFLRLGAIRHGWRLPLADEVRRPLRRKPVGRDD